MKRPEPQENTSADDLLISLTDVAEKRLDELDRYTGRVDFDESNQSFAMYEIAMESIYGPAIWDYIDTVVKERQEECRRQR